MHVINGHSLIVNLYDKSRQIQRHTKRSLIHTHSSFQINFPISKAFPECMVRSSMDWLIFPDFLIEKITFQKYIRIFIANKNESIRN